MPKLDFLVKDIDDLKQSGLYNTIRTLESANSPWVMIDGKKLLNLSSNNYLGLANHPEMIKAAKDAVDKYGVGAGAVRSIAGTMDLHIKLEEALARFKGREARHRGRRSFRKSRGRGRRQHVSGQRNTHDCGVDRQECGNNDRGPLRPAP